MEYKYEVTCKQCDVEYDSDVIMYFCPKCKHGGLVHEKQKLTSQSVKTLR